CAHAHHCQRGIPEKETASVHEDLVKAEGTVLTQRRRDTQIPSAVGPGLSSAPLRLCVKSVPLYFFWNSGEPSTAASADSTFTPGTLLAANWTAKFMRASR